MYRTHWRAFSRWTLLLWCCCALGSADGVARASPAAEPAAELTDAETERLLTRGKVTRIERLEIGTTHPLRVWVERGDRQVSGCFKSVDIQKTGITHIAGSGSEINFTDRHVYDQAAYLLDRELGLSLVPVAVPRQIRGSHGTLVFWIDDVYDELQRVQEKLRPPTPRELNHQLACMRVFDALIYNADRNAGNILYARADWRLHLIDHTRSFRIYDRLPERFLRLPTTLPRQLYERLQQLEEKRLQKLLKGLVNRGRIRAMLARRDLILEKIERDREIHGDAKTFQEVTGSAAEPPPTADQQRK